MPKKIGTQNFMPVLFRVCRHRQEARWVVRVEDRLYGEYLDKDGAVRDAIEAVKDAREIGKDAEVWDQARALRLY
jgi:hypothetical protein